MSPFAAIRRILGHALLGGVIAPLFMLLPSIAIYIMDKRCGSPGDSGGCEMGIAVNLIMAVPVGLLFGTVYGLWTVTRDVRAKGKPKPPLAP